MIEDWIRKAKENPKVGIVLLHNGIVRATSKKGGVVNGLIVKAEEKKIKDIENEAKKKKGIFYCKIKINEGKLKVGEDIMRVLVAADFRKNCFPVMEEIVGRVKDVISEQEI